MAGEATHIILADEILTTRSTSFDRKSFIAGTVFPDIRYLGEVDRETTHTREISFYDVVGEQDAFVAGVKFHSLVDKTRNDFIKDVGLYDLCPPFLYDQQALKFLEDELFYPEYHHWNEVAPFLQEKPQVPESYGVADDVVARWYNEMHAYISVAPNDVSRKHLLSIEGYTNEAIILINAYIEELKKDKAVTDLMRDFFKEFLMLI